MTLQSYKKMWRMIISILYPLVINCPVPKSCKPNWLYVDGYSFQVFEKGLLEMSFKRKHPQHCGKRIWDHLIMVWMWRYLSVTGTHNPEDSSLSTATTFMSFPQASFCPNRVSFIVSLCHCAPSCAIISWFQNGLPLQE